MPLVLSSWVELPIGKAHRPTFITDALKRRIKDQPIYVLREATHEDWRQSVIDGGGDPDWWDETPYYYEVTTD